MRESIREKLSELARTEYESGEGRKVRGLYGRPGRFIIERRRISYISTGKSDEPISLRVHPIKIDFPEHSHDFIELMYVYSGSITHRIGDSSVRISEGDVIIFGKEARHSVAAAEEGDVGINLVISAELYEKLLSDIRRESPLDPSLLASVLESGSDRYVSLSTGGSDIVRNIIENIAYSGLMTESDRYVMRTSVALLLSYLIGHGSGGATAARSKERRLYDYLSSSYASATLTEAAELLGLSPSYLSRWCRERLSRTFKELVMDERFSAACELLSKTDMPVGEIITTVGYENSSYFHKEFKHRLGTTPKEYRHKANTCPLK